MDTSTELDIGFDRLLTFLHQEMRMTEVYQPIVIRTLIHNGGEASFIELANAIAEHHGKSVAELVKVVKRYPRQVLLKHGIVSEIDQGLQINLDLSKLSSPQKQALIEVCDIQLRSFQEKKQQHAPNPHERTWEADVAVESYPEGISTPQKTISKVTQFDRDPKVRAWLLRAAEGVCECCHTEAPFNQPDGTAYLEIHHLRQLADGGSDTIQNAVVVCPNCHRELHFGSRKPELTRKLYQEINRLVPE